MPQAYSPAAVLRVPATIPDGHSTGAEAWRDTLDALLGMQTALLGRLFWVPRMYTSGTRSGGLASNTGVYVGAIAAAVLADPDGTIRVHAIAATQLHTGTHGPGTALAASTEYYVYAYVATNGAAPTYLVTTTAPTDGVWHPSLSTRRYIGSFTTNSAGVPRPFSMTSGRYLYDLDGGDVLADFQIYSGDPGGVQQDISLQSLVPPTSKRMILRWTAYSTGAAAVFSAWRDTMPATAVATLDAPTAPGGGTAVNTETTLLPVDINPAVSSTFNAVSVGGNGGGVAAVDLYALGYEEPVA